MTAPTSTRSRWGELAGVVQFGRLAGAAPRLRRAPRGDGGPVVVLPGHGFDDATTLPLRRFLASRGHDVHGWGLGPNRRHARDTVPDLVDRLEPLAERHGRPVALVGQSLGGYVAREAARARPDLVAVVVTLGTPIYAPLGAGPIRCPILALWSPVDGVVPRSRSTAAEPGATNVEVRSTHFAMGVDPDVWLLTADALAARHHPDGGPAPATPG